TYSKEDPGADLLAEDLELNDRGISFTLRIAGARTHIQSPLIGAFNISNLLALAGVLYLMRFGSDDISRRLSSVRGVRGRMDVLKNQNFPTIVVDYAHTPDALDKALQAIRAHCQGKLWCVFGCGGDRDKGKRPEMGAIASRLADRIVVTDDNPRYEESEAIIEDILAGKELSCESEIVPDRSAAISKAIKNAGPSDWVLIAGKGHEDYQEIRGQRFPYSDYDVVKELIGGNTGKH
ncbi:MAG: UDP-N-acetylmuramyl-tripeptide synthetase, partial [Gammaproteobacteria bacterium]|nr:UDP-N-acetylmuramyl-tripeptide synthetase [Gammaproteobacteria bacterium]